MNTKRLECGEEYKKQKTKNNKTKKTRFHSDRNMNPTYETNTKHTAKNLENLTNS